MKTFVTGVMAAVVMIGAATAQAQNRDLVDTAVAAGQFKTLAAALKAAGAQVAAITSMGGHFCIGELLPISPLPILNGIPEVDAAVARGRFKTIGIIGTRMVMETRLYGAISSATVVVPPGAELEEVHENYAAMATAGRVSDAQRRVFLAAGERLCREQGAEVVLNGHEHLYERFVPLRPDGSVDEDRGLRQFTVGTGGGNLRDFEDIQETSEARASVHGVLQLTLYDDRYDWEFLSVDDTYTDAGSGACH